MSEQVFEKIYGRPKSMSDRDTHYCPGCGHGIAHKLVAECIDEFGIRDTTIMVPPVGCAVLAYHYFDIDMLEAPHGRPLAVATGMKRMLPDHFILTYQGDGDLASIGAAETLHAANRGEKVTTIYINNAIYGMTGGQMAPTSIAGQMTSTTPGGRNPQRDGSPMDISEMIALVKGSIYIERCSLSSAKNIRRAKKAIRLHDPDAGFVATANGPIARASYPHYIGLDYAPNFRTRRVVARIEALEQRHRRRHGGDSRRPRVHPRARELVALLGGSRRERGGRPADPGERALASGAGPPGRVGTARSTRTRWRRRLRRRCASDSTRDLMTPILGPLAPKAFATVQGGGASRTWCGSRRSRRDDRQGQPDPVAAGRGVARGARERARGRGVGPPRGARRRHGRLALGALAHDAPRAPPGRGLPEPGATLNPPAVAVGGDGETVNATGFVPVAGYSVALTSVARYVFDLADWESSGWSCPTAPPATPAARPGPGQLPARADAALPMRYAWSLMASQRRSRPRR